MSGPSAGPPRPPRRHGAVLEEMLEALDAAGPYLGAGAFADRVRESRYVRFDDELVALAGRLRIALAAEAHRLGPILVDRLAGLVESLPDATGAVRTRPSWAREDAGPKRRGVTDGPRYRRALFASLLARARASGRTTEEEAEDHDVTPAQVAEAQFSLPNLAATEVTYRRLGQIRRAIGADRRRNELALERGAARIGATPEEEDALREHRGYVIPSGRLIELRDRALALRAPEALACRSGQADGEPVLAGTDVRLSALFGELVQGVSLRTWLTDHPDIAPVQVVGVLRRAFTLLRDDALQASDLPEGERRHAAATSDWLFEACAEHAFAAWPPAGPEVPPAAVATSLPMGAEAEGSAGRATGEGPDPMVGFLAGVRHLMLHMCERRGRPLREAWVTELRRCGDTAVLETLFDVLDVTGEEAVVDAAFAAAERVHGPGGPPGPHGASLYAGEGNTAPGTAPQIAVAGGFRADAASPAPGAVDESDRRRIAWAVDGDLGLPYGSTDPGRLEILAYAPLLHSGWECDSDAALVRLPGEGALTAVVYAGTSATRPLSAYVRSLLPTYSDALVRGAHLAAALEREGL